jgi:4'-phosphopantetheinyl transferase
VTADLWTIPLDVDDARARTLLSPHELARADRFVFPRDARRFTVCRAAVRAILAGYLGERPEEVRFAYGRRGKPVIAGRDDLHFNVAHSGELALCAVSREGALGVDVEELRPVADCAQLAARVFSPAERAALAAVDGDPSPVFLAGWTRKEAIVKAEGEGLHYPLEELTVTLGEPPRVVAPAGRWWLADLRPADGFVGALAASSAVEINVRTLP